MDGACRKDHFLVGHKVGYGAVCKDLDADATSTFEVEFHHVGMEQQSEVRPRQRRPQEGAYRTHAGPIRGDVHVDVAGARKHRPVHVVQNRHAHLAGCVNEGRRCGVRILRPADVDGTAGAAPGIIASLPVLLTFEDRKHV
jgi:hypothetical protein